MATALASLALLKANLDAYQRDSIETFVPLVLALIYKKGYPRVDPYLLCEDFPAEYGLYIPYHAMMTIIKRAQTRRFLTRSHGDLVPVREKTVLVDISHSIEQQELHYQHVISSFVSFCVTQYRQELSEQEADRAFISCLADHDLDILFMDQGGETVLPAVAVSSSHRFLMHRFIEYVHKVDPLVFGFIVDISVGHIIANTVLIRDYERMQGSLKKLSLYLDTGFLFSVTGIDGPAVEEVFAEWVRLVGSHGASLLVFRHTFREFLAALESCLRWIEDPHFDVQRASRACLSMHDLGWTLSDVEELTLHLDERLARLGIAVVDTPAPMEHVEFQIGEADLQKLIVDLYSLRVPNFRLEERDYTIYQDVRSISAIYKLRKGNLPRSLPRAGHVFVTTNATLAYASRQFERSQSGAEFYFTPAALTDVFVGTLCWIHSPSNVAIAEKRLIAMAYATQQPSRTFIGMIVDTAERLRKRGEITEEECAALTESRLGRNLVLAETCGDQQLLNDDAVLSAAAKYKKQIQTEVTERFEQEREGWEGEVQQAQADVQQAQLNEQQAQVAAQEARRLASHVQAALELSEQRVRELQSWFDEKARREATLILWGSWGIAVAVWLGALLIIPRIWAQAEPYLEVAGMIPLLLGLFYFAAKHQVFSIPSYIQLVEWRKRRLYRQANFDWDVVE